MKLKAAAFAALVLIVFSSCQPRSRAVLLTNIPELAAYVEFYDAAVDDSQIQVVYAPQDELPALIGPGIDLVVAEHLDSPRLIDSFSALDRLFEDPERDRPGIDRGNVYSALLEAGRREDRQVLLPVSFTLGGIMTATEAAEGQSLTLESLRDRAADFSGAERLGFSPRWSDDFALEVHRMLGSNFREGENSILVWNTPQVDAANQLLDEWADELAGEREFTEKYLYEPAFSLLNSGRIGFHFVTVDEFFLIPAEQRERLNLYWLENDGKIAANQRIIWAGIPSSSSRKRAAREFLGWFFEPANQLALLQDARSKRIRTFGLAGGLSPLVSVNERDFTRLYPFLAGRIPPSGSLTSPSPLPVEWQTLEEEVVLPWLGQSRTERSTDSLEESLRRWLLQRPVY
jgi:hypothetical protein